jgi:hypothetical protein
MQVAFRLYCMSGNVLDYKTSFQEPVASLVPVARITIVWTALNSNRSQFQPLSILTALSLSRCRLGVLSVS